MRLHPKDREQIAEIIWRAEYRRATGRERNVDWEDGVLPMDKNSYRYLADAIIAEVE